MTRKLEGGEDSEQASTLITGAEFPIPLTPDGRITTYDNLWRRYTKSEIGKHHATQKPRFSDRYGYAPREAMFADLGPDVHPLGHMDDVQRILKKLLLAELGTHKTLGNLALPDVTLVRLIAQTHDVGENTHPSFPKTVDDIPYGDKQPWQRKIEQDVRRDVFERCWNDLPHDLLERADVIIMHEPEEERDVVAHEHVEAAHNIGSYVTGLVSGRLAIQAMEALEMQRSSMQQLPEDEAHRITQLQRLSIDVTRSMRPTMEELSNTFEYAAIILRDGEVTYEDIGLQLAA